MMKTDFFRIINNNFIILFTTINTVMSKENKVDRDKKKNKTQRIELRTQKIKEMKIEQKIFHLQRKLPKFKDKLDDLTRLSLGKQYKIEDLESEIYELEQGENVDDDRLNDNDDEVDESFVID